MKVILGLLGGLLVLCFASVLAPAIIGIFIGIVQIESGNISGGVTAILIGLAINAFIFWYCFPGGGSGYDPDDEECPFCGSSATDGNHCDDCGGDY